MKTLELGMQGCKECDQSWEGRVEAESLTESSFRDCSALAVLQVWHAVVVVVGVGRSSFLL